MHPAYIIAELAVRGVRMTDIARDCNVSFQAVHNTVYGKPFPSPRIREKIARVVERPVDEIWPDRAHVAA